MTALLHAVLDALDASVVVAGVDGRIALITTAARARLGAAATSELEAATDADRAGLCRRLGAHGATVRELPDACGGGTIAILPSTGDDELHRANAFLDSIVENIPNMIFVKDAEHLRFERFNRAGEQLLGQPREALLGKSDHDFFPSDQAAFFQAKDRETLRAGAVVDIEEEPIDTPSGQRWLHTKKIPIRDADGTPRYLLGISEDVTERKVAREALLRIHDELERRVAERTDALRRTEDHLREAQKLEAVGRLASGVAHDFNNLLTVIMTQASALHGYGGDEARVRRAADGIVDAARRAANLTRQLLAFSRRQVLRPQRLELPAVIADLAPTLAGLLGDHLTLTIDPPPARAAWIDVDPGQIEQVILNLVINARDAMPERGRVTLGVTRDDTHVVLHVVDTGVGMDAETQARIFEPFFTTKAAGRGTGLGLATVYGIVAQSGGNIRVESAPGRGARFEVSFPARPPAGTLAPARVTTRDVGGETLLLVEDDPAVRASLDQALRGAGYAVVSAPDGDAALALVETYADPIHALITDVVMPGPTGFDLAAAVRRKRPTVRVLFVSGFASNPGVEAPAAGEAFLAKPFEPATLLRAVRDLLDG